MKQKSRQMYLKHIYGNCSFELIEKFEDAKKAASGQQGSSVEVKLSNYKIEFTKVRREDDESQTGTPKTEGQGAKKV